MRRRIKYDIDQITKPTKKIKTPLNILVSEFVPEALKEVTMVEPRKNKFHT